MMSQELVTALGQLVVLYLAVGLFISGFAFMFRGPSGAMYVMEVFLRTIPWAIAQHIARFVIWVLRGIFRLH